MQCRPEQLQKGAPTHFRISYFTSLRAQRGDLGSRTLALSFCPCPCPCPSSSPSPKSLPKRKGGPLLSLHTRLLLRLYTPVSSRDTQAVACHHLPTHVRPPGPRYNSHGYAHRSEPEPGGVASCRVRLALPRIQSRGRSAQCAAIVLVRFHPLRFLSLFLFPIISSLRSHMHTHGHDVLVPCVWLARVGWDKMGLSFFDLYGWSSGHAMTRHRTERDGTAWESLLVR